MSKRASNTGTTAQGGGCPVEPFRGKGFDS